MSVDPVLYLPLEENRRLALAVLVGEGTRLEQPLESLRHRPVEETAQVLTGELVDQLFLDVAAGKGILRRLPPRLVELLAARRPLATMVELKQAHVLGQACALLDQRHIGYVVFKGALVRKFLYARPHLRPSADVDLLVEAGRVREAARLLEQDGYALTLAPHSNTHEVCLEKHAVGIDLHWNLFRPGRMRENISTEIVAQRVRRSELWSPSDTHLTVIMLVHPAITDHVTARLISAVDLDRWLRTSEAPWDKVLEVLGRMGLRAAAWAMLRWTGSLFATPIPDEVMAALAPSALRRRYIEAWLARDPAQLYRRWPNLVRGAFSLALHDRASDVAWALWQQARKQGRLVLDDRPQM